MEVKEDEENVEPAEDAFKKPTMSMVIESDSEDGEETTLYLSDSQISSIPKPPNNQEFTSLILSRNRVKDGANLKFYHNLQELNLDSNMMNGKFFFRLNEADVVLNKLEILYINKNSIMNLDIFLTCLAEVAPNLRQLSMMFNSCNDNDVKYKRYRLKAIFKLQRLQILDADLITGEERRNAMNQGPSLFSARPVTISDFPDSDEESEDETQFVQNVRSAAYIGKGKIKYDGRESEGNRFITNTDL